MRLTDDIVDIADLDVIYLSYDEPQKEEFWLKIKDMVPWAKRVDGVKGSDAAHKAAAKISDTDRFILIDGDNLPNEDFFNLQLDFTDKDPSLKLSQFRWKAINHINGLRYGNGGISSWTREYVFNMKTHENQVEGDVSRIVDFSMSGNDNLYHPMWDCYSVTYPNHTPFQAWRAGFREGVKMCLVRGAKPSIDEFKDSVASRNLDNLTIWHNVGADVENGLWAICGARMGTYKTMLTDWDHTEVQWFDNIKEFWEQRNFSLDDEISNIGTQLQDKLGLPMCLLSSDQSKFFKRHYSSDKYNMGPLVTEMEIIRKIQGW
jgi:hypothetical protein